MGPSKKNQKTKSKCSHCIRFEEIPIWGHPLCSYHRDCSGNDEWEPTKCKYCKKQKTSLAKMSTEEQQKSLRTLRDMLEQTEQHKNDQLQMEWNYEDSIQNWLPKYDIRTRSAEPKNAYSNVDNTEQQVDESIDNGNISQNVSTTKNIVDQDDQLIDTTDQRQYEGHSDREENDSDGSNEEFSGFIGNENRDSQYERDQSSVYEHPRHANERLSRREMFDIQQASRRRNNRQQPISANENRYDNSRQKRYRSPSVKYYDNSNYYQPSYDEYVDEHFHNMEDYEMDNIPYPNDNESVNPYINNHSVDRSIFQNNEIPPVKEFEIDYNTGITWVNFDLRIHVRKDNNKIQVETAKGPQLINVKYRIGNSMQFQTIPTTKNDNKSPFIDAREGHAVILSSFDRSVSNNDFGNHKYMGIESSLVAGSGLAETLNLLKSHETTLTQTTVDKGLTQLLEKFPNAAFDTVSIIDFTSGWNFSNSSTFAAFAKDKELDINAFINRIDGNPKQIHSRINNFLLKREKETRKTVVNILTPLHLLDLMGEKIDKLDDTIKNRSTLSSAQTNAIARTLLPVAKSVISTWMVAKMAVRNALLKNHDNPTIMKLLKSSLWDACIFAEEAINEIESSTGNNLPVMLGLTKFYQPKGNSFYNQPSKRMRMTQPQNPIQVRQNDFQNPAQNRTFRHPPPRKPQIKQPSPTRTNPRNWRTNFPSKDNETPDFKNQQTQQRNPNNYNRNKNTRPNRRGNQRK